MMAYMNGASALIPGESEIGVIADGSYQELIALGSWAFYIPTFELQNSGLESGSSIEHFELTAVLSGIEAILVIDRTPRPIHIFTDSDCALLQLQLATERKPLPGRPIFDRVRHLYDRCMNVASQRPLLLTRIKSGSSPEHRHCHLLASLELRGAVAADPALTRRLAAKRQQQRLKTLLKQRRDLTRKLAALEKEAASTQARLQELEQPPDAALAATGDRLGPLAADDVRRIRQAAALEVLDALDCLWTDDAVKIRRLFGLPIGRDLWESSLERFVDGPLPPTFEPEPEPE
jgi:hypothetical protein